MNCWPEPRRRFRAPHSVTSRMGLEVFRGDRPSPAAQGYPHQVYPPQFLRLTLRYCGLVLHTPPSVRYSARAYAHP